MLEKRFGHLQCIRSFKDVLSKSQPVCPSDSDEAQAAWKKYTRAQLRSFTRRYYSSIAPVAEAIQSEVFGSSLTDEEQEVKRNFSSSLNV